MKAYDTCPRGALTNPSVTNLELAGRRGFAMRSLNCRSHRSATWASKPALTYSIIFRLVFCSASESPPTHMSYVVGSIVRRASTL